MAGRYDKKYGLIEDKAKIKFHIKRRMFCIKDDRLYVARPHLPYSHAQWFENKGWMDEKNDSLMDKITRGYIDLDNNIYFYKGYDFRVDEQSENEMIKHLVNLVKLTNIKKNGRLFGGLIRNKNNEFVPLKTIGQINKMLLRD